MPHAEGGFPWVQCARILLPASFAGQIKVKIPFFSFLFFSFLIFPLCSSSCYQSAVFFETCSEKVVVVGFVLLLLWLTDRDFLI